MHFVYIFSVNPNMALPVEAERNQECNLSKSTLLIGVSAYHIMIYYVRCFNPDRDRRGRITGRRERTYFPWAEREKGPCAFGHSYI